MLQNWSEVADASCELAVTQLRSGATALTN